MLVASQAAVATDAVLLFDGITGWVTVTADDAAFLGGPNLTVTNGAPLSAAVPVPLFLNGEAVYAVTASTANVGWIAGNQ